MMEQLTCHACHARLNRVNLKVLKHVVLKCPECGQVNEYHYDPARYVEKESSTTPLKHHANGRHTPPDTLKSSKNTN